MTFYNELRVCVCVFSPPPRLVSVYVALREHKGSCCFSQTKHAQPRARTFSPPCCCCRFYFYFLPGVRKTRGKKREVLHSSLTCHHVLENLAECLKLSVVHQSLHAQEPGQESDGGADLGLHGSACAEGMHRGLGHHAASRASPSRLFINANSAGISVFL